VQRSLRTKYQFVLCVLIYCLVACYKKRVSEVVLTHQRIQNFLGDRIAEVYIRGNTQAKEIELAGIGVSLRSFRTC
jgi:hypothetical protein